MAMNNIRHLTLQSEMQVLYEVKHLNRDRIMVIYNNNNGYVVWVGSKGICNSVMYDKKKMVGRQQLTDQEAAIALKTFFNEWYKEFNVGVTKSLTDFEDEPSVEHCQRFLQTTFTDRSLLGAPALSRPKPGKRSRKNSFKVEEDMFSAYRDRQAPR
eukprot:GILJ01007414.1.p1 GENE.GILJ01007414.1~~GILJ01007414.1.p1  ORF type:complete len:156 (+),score=12.82 GILJ01007414.1:135-602(+)